jgi:hypothetical protein
LPANTVIPVKTTAELNGDNLKVGQEVICVVAMNITADDEVVIKAGTPVICQVDNAEGSGMVGSGGELAISVQSTTTVDNKNIMLTGSLRAKGESSTGSSIAIGVILCPLALLFSGDDAIIPAGTQIRAMTLAEIKVNVKKQGNS